MRTALALSNIYLKAVILEPKVQLHSRAFLACVKPLVLFPVGGCVGGGGSVRKGGGREKV